MTIKCCISIAQSYGKKQDNNKVKYEPTHFLREEILPKLFYARKIMKIILSCQFILQPLATSPTGRGVFL